MEIIEVIWTALQILGALTWSPQHKPAEQMVFQNKEEFAKVWVADGGRADQLPERYDEIGEIRTHDLEKRDQLPKVDFKKHTMLAVFAGAKPNSGHSVRILNVVESQDGKNVMVIYDEIKPVSGVKYAEEIVYPSSVVVVKKLTSKVRFANANTDEAKTIQAKLKK
ncbi:MAG: protease complex subunit PrcB family protein [Planctomycetota bacterium]